MKIEKSNHLIQQPSSARELLRKIDRYLETPIANKAFDEFIVPHLKFIETICENATKPYTNYFGNHLAKELYSQLLVALYRNPKRLLQAVKSVKDPKNFEKLLRLKITIMCEKILKQAILKEEKAYKKVFKHLENIDISDCDSDDEAFQDYETETAEHLADEDFEDEASTDSSLPIEEPEYDPEEELLVKEDDNALYRKVLRTMSRRDRLILVAILPYLEKGRHIPKELRKKLMKKHKLTSVYLSKLIVRIKERFKKKAIVFKQQIDKVL